MKWFPHALAALALMGCDIKDLLGDDTDSRPTDDTATTNSDDTAATDDTGDTRDTGDIDAPLDLSCELISTSPRTLEVARDATLQTGLRCEGESIDQLATFSVVIGLNNSTSEPAQPLDALLETDESGAVFLTTEIPEGLITEAGAMDYTVHFSKAAGDSSSSSSSDSLSSESVGDDSFLTVSGGEVLAHEALSNPAEELMVPSFPLLEEGFSVAEISATARLGDFGDGETRLGAVRRDGNDLIAALCDTEGVCEIETFVGAIEDIDGEIPNEGGRWVEPTDGGLVYLWWGEVDADASASCCRTISMKPIRLELSAIDMGDEDESWLTDGTLSARLGESVDELLTVLPTAPLASDTSGLPGLVLFYASGEGDERQFVLYDNGKSTLFRYFGELDAADVTWAALLPQYDARDGSVEETSWHIAAMSADDPGTVVMTSISGREVYSENVSLPEPLATPDWAAFDVMDLDSDGVSEVVVTRGDAASGDGIWYIPRATGPGDTDWGEAVGLEDPAEVTDPMLMAARMITAAGAGTTGLYVGEGEYSAPMAVTMRAADNDPTPTYMTIAYAAWPRDLASGRPTGKRDMLDAGTTAVEDYTGPQLIPFLGDSEPTEDDMGRGDVALVGQAVPGGPATATRACCTKQLDKSSPKLATSADGGIDVVGVNGLSVLPLDGDEPLMQFDGGGFGASVAVSLDGSYSVVGFSAGAVVGGHVTVSRDDYTYWDLDYTVDDTWSIETPLDAFAALPLSEEDGTSLWVGESGEEVRLAVAENPLFAEQAQANANALYSGFAPRSSLDHGGLSGVRRHSPGWLRVVGGDASTPPAQVSEETLRGTWTADLPEGWEEGAYEAVMVVPWETGTECPLATVLVAGVEGALSDNKDKVVVLDTSEDPTCADLALPMVSGSLMGGGSLQHVLYKVHLGGSEVQVVYRHPTLKGELHTASHHGLYSIAARSSAPVGSSADINGDGLDDVLIQDASGSLLLVSDGEGGFLNEGDEVSSEELANLLSFVGSGPGQSLRYQDGSDLILRKRPGHPRH